MMIRRLFALRNAHDAERESFSIFSKLAGKTESSEIEKIADEIMTLSLKDLQELSQALNDPAIIGKRTNELPLQSSFPLPVNRSPFPHPKHVFAGVDSDKRPGMRNP